MQISYPQGILSRYVKIFWGLDRILLPGEEHVQRIVPTGLPELTFHLSEIPEVVGKERSLEAPSLISGQQRGYYDLRIQGQTSLFSIIFQPHGLSAFLDMPAGELLNSSVPFRYVHKGELDRLEDRLAENPDFASRVRQASDFLLKLLSGESYDFRRFHQSISLLNRQGGRAEIDELASAACLGRKQFERGFRKYVGDSPGKFLRTVRFQRALYEASRDRTRSLTRVAHESGYYDQAHMIHDFTRLSGMTPRQYFSAPEIFSDYFS